jgi:hypothetical protein
LKVIIKTAYNVDLKYIYSHVKPLVDKNVFIKRIRDEVSQYVKACLDTSTNENGNGLEDNIIYYLIQDGYAEAKSEHAKYLITE